MATSPSKRDEDFGKIWGDGGKTAKLKARQWCFDNGYRVAQLKDNGNWYFSAECSDPVPENWSRMYSNHISNEQGFGLKRDTAMDADCKRKGYSGLQDDKSVFSGNIASSGVYGPGYETDYSLIFEEDFHAYSVKCKDPPEGTSMKCKDFSDSAVYRLTKDKVLRHYPDPDIASSWDVNWGSNILQATDCNKGGYKVGQPLQYNSDAVQGYCSNTGNIKTETCKTWCSHHKGACDTTAEAYCNSNPQDPFCSCFGKIDDINDDYKKLNDKLRENNQRPLTRICNYKNCVEGNTEVYKTVDMLNINCPPQQICLQELNVTGVAGNSNISGVNFICNNSSDNKPANKEDDEDDEDDEGDYDKDDDQPPLVIQPIHYIIGAALLLIILLFLIF